MCASERRMAEEDVPGEQVRKALNYLEEERVVTRTHVKEKDKDREARTRQRAEARSPPGFYSRAVAVAFPRVMDGPKKKGRKR